MKSFLVMTGVGLMVHRADVMPAMAADREIAGEPRGLMRMACAWTGAALGVKPCLPEQHGQVSHGISPAAKARLIEEIKTFPVSK
jgi:hypothetical protein